MSYGVTKLQKIAAVIYLLFVFYFWSSPSPFYLLLAFLFLGILTLFPQASFMTKIYLVLSLISILLILTRILPPLYLPIKKILDNKEYTWIYNFWEILILLAINILLAILIGKLWKRFGFFSRKEI